LYGRRTQADLLAVALELPIEELETHMARERPLPHQAFITALDIVANGKE